MAGKMSNKFVPAARFHSPSAPEPLQPVTAVAIARKKEHGVGDALLAVAPCETTRSKGTIRGHVPRSRPSQLALIEPRLRPSARPLVTSPGHVPRNDLHRNATTPSRASLVSSPSSRGFTPAYTPRWSRPPRREGLHRLRLRLRALAGGARPSAGPGRFITI
jgi:hypothetical protein